MADDLEVQNEGNEGAGALDLASFIPETFKKDDGAFDTAGFRARFDELAAEKAAAEEAAATLPKSPEEYAFALAADHAFPEGFDPEALASVDDKGNKIAFDPAALIAADDPDVKLAQALLHEIKAPAGVAQKLAGIMANRELRQVMEAAKTAEAEKAKLGPEAKTRIDVVTRSLKANLEAPLAKALIDSLTSADALRGVESLLKKGRVAPAAQDAKPDLSQLSPRDRILAGLQQRRRA
jgi:hypothetical protein